jgi:hypothetical protein
MAPRSMMEPFTNLLSIWNYLFFRTTSSYCGIAGPLSLRGVPLGTTWQSPWGIRRSYGLRNYALLRYAGKGIASSLRRLAPRNDSRRALGGKGQYSPRTRSGARDGLGGMRLSKKRSVVMVRLGKGCCSLCVGVLLYGVRGGMTDFLGGIDEEVFSNSAEDVDSEVS